jgi:hypothetical protein
MRAIFSLSLPSLNSSYILLISFGFRAVAAFSGSAGFTGIISIVEAAGGEAAHHTYIN